MAETSTEEKKTRVIVPVPAEMMGKTTTGTVTTVVKNKKYNFGFISLATDEKANDPSTPAIYYNPSGLKEKVFLRRGYVVKFVCGTGEDGRTAAQDITLVSPTLEEIQASKAKRDEEKAAAAKAAEEAKPVPATQTEKAEAPERTEKKKRNSKKAPKAEAEADEEKPAAPAKAAAPKAEKPAPAKKATPAAPASKAEEGEKSERNPLLPDSYVGKTGLIGVVSTLYRRFRYGFITLGTGEEAKKSSAYVVHFRLNKVPKEVTLDRDFVVSFSVAKDSEGRTIATDIKLTPEGEEQKRKRDALREQARDQQERIHLLEEKEESAPVTPKVEKGKKNNRRNKSEAK